MPRVVQVAVDERMRELPLPLAELQSVRLQLVATGGSLTQCLPFCDEDAKLFLKALDASHTRTGG
jgi:hypothetical protein